MTKKIHKLLFYTLLLSVYGLFFSVESFYNFEGQLNTAAFFKYTRAQLAKNGQSVVKASSSHSSPTHNFRLNKRFHQEEISPCPVFQVAAPESYVIPRVLGSYRTIILPIVTLIHRPLRGPPSVA